MKIMAKGYKNGFKSEMMLLRKKVFPQFVISALLILSLYVLTVSAQSSSCDLQINVFNSSNSEKIEEAKLTLVNFATFDIEKAKLKDGKKMFNGVKNGRYRIKIENKEFKTSFKRIYLNCEKDLQTEDILLQSGDSKENLFFLDDDYNLTTSGEIFFKDDVNVIGISMPRPVYRNRCSSDCEVKVLVLIDEQGNVVSAQAISGQQYLHKITEQAAIKSKFLPVVYKGTPIKVKGVMKYYFK